MHDAEEIAQDVFVKIYQNSDNFKNTANIKTWIYRITINQCLDFLKAKRTQKRFAFISAIFSHGSEATPTFLSDFNHPGIDLEQKEAMHIIFSCLNQLPESQKTALILHKIEHQSQVEIADIMQLSPKAVESLIQRAKMNLQKKLSACEGM